MELTLTRAEQEIIEVARQLNRDQVIPRAAQWELQREVPVGTIRAAAGAGLAGLLVPPRYGGKGASYVATARVLEELARGCFSFAFSLVVHNNLVGNIARNGTQAQIDQYLPAMLRGERIGAFCLTEPAAGSDAASITTRAKRMDDRWELTGEKAWITNGAVADIFSVYAQTDPERGWRGIACFLVEGNTPGLQKEAPYLLMGGHAMGTNGVRLSGCRIPASSLLLGPGDGFKEAMAAIDIGRVLVAAMCCGMLQVGLECALEYAVGRRTFGRSIAQFQGLQWTLAEVATDLEAARLLTYRAAAVLDRGVRVSVEAAHAKKFATRVALTGLSSCMQVMGASGYRAGYPLGRHLGCAKMAQYLDGTTEIQNVVISRSLLRPYGVDVG